MSESFVGLTVRFTGFTGEEQPDNGELLVEGEEYLIDSEVEPPEEGADLSYYLQVDNPKFDAKKRKTKGNPEFLLVDCFPEEFELVEEGEGEEASGAEELAYADLKPGMTVTVDDGDEEGAITGKVVKALKTKLTLRDGAENVELDVKDIQSIVAADGEEEEEEVPAPKAKAKAPAKAPAKKAAAKAPANKAATKGKAAAEEEEAPTKAKGKTKAKAKAAPAKAPAKAKAKEEEEDEDLKGLIILTEEEEDSEILELVGEAEDLCELAHDMAEESAAQDYRLGGVLYHVQVTKAYKALDERYEEKGGFALYIQEQLGLGYRKAMYLVEIYTKFNKYGISGEKVAEIGWTKAQVIASAMQQDNAEELIELAEANTVEDLKDTIKESYSNKPGEKGEPVKRVTFKFRLLEDAGQVIRGYVEEAKEQLGVEKDDEAFEHIISEWAQEHLSAPKSRVSNTTTGKGGAGRAKPSARKAASK
jgi:hypothetical protein